MGRLERRAALRTIAAAAALMLVPAPGGAQDLPRLAYPALNPDERLALDGAPAGDDGASPYAALIVAASARVRIAQTYAPAPAIWKIGDADTTIYLFGTIHSLPPGFRWRNAGLERVLAESQSLMLESTGQDDEEVSFTEGLPAGPNHGLPPLAERVSAPFRSRLESFAAALPPGAVEQLDAMPTWIAAMAVGYVRELMAGDIRTPGADDWLETHFRARGLKVEAIEDSKGVVASINAIPEDAQRLMLEAALIAPTRSRETLDAPVNAWAQGNVGADSPLVIAPDDLDPSAALADPLLARRNRAWAESLTARLRTPGVLLFAAGAGHFVGKGSVLELLEAHGIRVTRVQ